MEEMHYFKESQREEIPVPDFKDNITRKLLLQFLCDLCTWAQATPVTSVGIKKDAHIKKHLSIVLSFGLVLIVTTTLQSLVTGTYLKVMWIALSNSYFFLATQLWYAWSIVFYTTIYILGCLFRCFLLLALAV